MTVANDRPTYLLTGSTGFIGTCVSSELRPHANLVHLCRRSNHSALANDRIIEIDLADPDWDISLPPHIDGVLHMAQSPNYRDFPDCAPEVTAINVAATARLLDIAVRSGAKSFCLLSTGSVYEPYVGSLNEGRELTPQTINGCTKAAAEMLTGAYEGTMAVSRLRLFMPYGPGQVDKLLPAIIDRVASGAAVDLANGTGPMLSPIYVDDAARLIVRALLEGWEGTYNVSSHEVLTLAQIADAIGERLGVEVCRNIINANAPRLVPELTRLETKTPKAFISFADGLGRVLIHREEMQNEP